MDLYNELLSFREALKDYRELLSKSQSRQGQPLPADYQPYRENLLTNSSHLLSQIKMLTGKDESLEIYVMGKPRVVNMWQMGLRNEYDYRTSEAVDACIDNTTIAIGKLEADIRLGIRDKQGNLVEKGQAVTMSKFSNRTLSYVVEILSDRSDTKLRNFFFKHGLLNIYTQSGRLTAKQRKINDVFQHLCTAGDESAMETLGLIVREFLKDTQAWLKDRGKNFPEVFPELERGLNADGFQVCEGELVPLISPTVEPAKEEGLVERLLNKHGFTVAKTHLEQAYDNYLDGNWEASNGALRSFLQDVFDQIALILYAEESVKKEPGGETRKLLQEKGFIEGNTESKLVSSFFSFASYSGSHPGISSESDCRLRRYIAIALASYYLEKLGEFHVQTI